MYNYGSGYTTTNIIIENCTLYKGYHTTGIDISCGNSATADYDGIIFRNNLIYEDIAGYNYGSELMNIESYYSAHYINNIQIYNNILIGSQNSAIHLYGIHGVDIYNNTFINHNTSATGNTAHIKMTSADCTDVVIKNNIFYTILNVESNSRGNALYTSTAQTTANITMDYNIYYRVNASYRILEIRDGATTYHYNDIANIRTGLGWETHGQTINPSFISSIDFHLNTGSPAIGNGVYLLGVVDTDYSGLTRTNPPSIGAYDYVVSYTLTVQDGVSAHTADNIILSVVFNLVISDGVSALTNDTILLSQVHILTVQDGLNLHTADNVTLSPTISGAIMKIWRGTYWEIIATFGNSTAPVADGVYTVGLGVFTDGIITVINGVITAITEAT
jgi:hypothetical protein